MAAATLMPGFSGTTMPGWIVDALAAGMGSVCIYGTNVVSPGQLKALLGQLRDSSDTVLLTMDEEGGDVTRLHYLTGPNQPGNAVLGRINDEATTAAAAADSIPVTRFGRLPISCGPRNARSWLLNAVGHVRQRTSTRSGPPAASPVPWANYWLRPASQDLLSEAPDRWMLATGPRPRTPARPLVRAHAPTKWKTQPRTRYAL